MATNTAPTIANLQGDAATQVEGAGGTSFVDVGRNAVIADGDSTDFAGGRLTVAVTSGFQTNDHVGIFQDGVVALNFTTGAVTVNGIEIGTAAGGYITSPSSPVLTIDFNANATPALVQTLLRGIFVRDPFSEPRGGARDVQVTLSDGDGGESSYTTQLQVTPVNDAPAGTDSTLSLNEDQPVALTAANFGFDQHGGSTSSEGQSLLAVTITTLPTAGTLYLDLDGAGTGSLGTAVTAGQSVSAADIAAGRLVYAPAANASGAGYASFTFQVQDSGGTTNGGQDTDQSPNTLTFDVTAVNDSPVANPDSYSTAEDTPVQFSIASLLANDTDADGDAITLFGFESPQNGTYTVNGGIVTFTPDQDFVGDATLDYTITDDNGGTSVGRATVTVAAVNDAPVVDLDTDAPGVNDSNLFVEGTLPAGIGRTIGVSDVDSATLARATVTITDPAAGDQLVANLPLPGGITIDPASTATTFILVGAASAEAYAEALGQIGYTSSATDPTFGGTDGTRSITVVVNDGALDSAPATMTITVINSNAAPVADLDGASGGIDTTAAYTEDTAAVKLTPGIVLSDADSANLTGATVTIASGFVAGDIVRVANGQSGTTADGIAYSYNGATGVLTLSGSASVAAYQAALATLAFKTNSNTPGTARDIVVTVTDGAATSIAAHVVLTVTPVNDAPTVANLQGDVSTFTEGGGAFTTSLDVGLNALVSDPDNANFNGGSLNIAVTGGVAAEDFIYFNNGNPAFGLTFSGNTISQGGVAFATFNAPGADRTFTFLSDGSATPARVEQLIRSLTYYNSNQANPSEGAHTVTYTLTDGSGGTSITTATVNVVAVNDMPGVDLNGPGSGIDTAASYTEGASGVKLAPAVVVSDPDGTLTGATATIASGFVAGDILRLSGGQNGTTSDGISFSYNGATGVLTLSGSASVAAYQAALATLGFKSNSTDPGPARDIVVTVTDGVATSTAAHVALSITEVADAPAASAFDFSAVPEMAASGGDPFLGFGFAPSMMVTDLSGADQLTPDFGEDYAGTASQIMFDPAFADLML